jgi:hypothetical protein
VERELRNRTIRGCQCLGQKYVDKLTQLIFVIFALLSQTASQHWNEGASLLASQQSQKSGAIEWFVIAHVSVLRDEGHTCNET